MDSNRFFYQIVGKSWFANRFSKIFMGFRRWGNYFLTCVYRWWFPCHYYFRGTSNSHSSILVKISLIDRLELKARAIH